MCAKVVRLKSFILLGLLLIFAAFMMAASVGCEEDKPVRRMSVEFRDENFARAQAKHPDPAQQNFPRRGLLREYTLRQDLENHPWYVYRLGENGNVVHYFVSTTEPVNSCAFLSSTEDVQYSSYGNMVLTAPSLDGIFYGGAGASSACTGWIVKDAATNAIGIIYGDDLLVFDQPLLLEAEPVRIQIQPAPQRKQP